MSKCFPWLFNKITEWLFTQSCSQPWQYSESLSCFSLCCQSAVCALCRTVLSTRRPTNATSWVSAQMCLFQPTSAPQVQESLQAYCNQLPCETLKYSCCYKQVCVCHVEFSLLVDVSSERSCQPSVMGEDDISSRYQFVISSANTQPTDRGEHTNPNGNTVVFQFTFTFKQYTIHNCLLVKSAWLRLICTDLN